jgi:hypothetical protein
MATAGQQPHALALTLDDQSIAVVLYLAKPIRPGWDFRAERQTPCRRGLAPLGN